tara:strand:+ start:245 stop:784 length:540 start_codon:yes stop_codon:yes gene_type:complete
MSPSKKAAGVEKQESASKDKRMSQQRRQRQNTEKDEEENLTSKNTIDKKYLSIPVDEINAEAESKLSPSKQPCPKSPTKRMRNLEQKEEQNKEDIETTYKKVHCENAATSDDDDSEVISPEPTMSETNGMQAKFAQEIKFGLQSSPKSLLPQASQLAKADDFIDIQDILDVDSNVINYG